MEAEILQKMNEELLTKQELAKFLKVKPRVIAYLTSTRQIPFIKGIGREYKYLKPSIMEWLKAKEIKGNKYEHF